MTERRLALDDGSLVDVLDRLLDVGAYIDGSVLLTLADVDLVRLDLRLLLASIDTLHPSTAQVSAPPAHTPQALAAEAGKGRARTVRRQGATTYAPTGGTRTPASDQSRSEVQPAKLVGTPNGAPSQRTTPQQVHTAPDLSADAPDDADDRNTGIAGLVVVLVDIVRQLLERQALRRMDAGTLTEAEVERLGQALMALEEQTAELTEFLSMQRNKTVSPGLARREVGHRTNSSEGRARL